MAVKKSMPQLTVGRSAAGRTWPDLPKKDAAQALALQFQLQQTEKWPPARLLRQQMLQLQRLARHALATVPYYGGPAYGKTLRRLAKSRADDLTAESFAEIPLLTRSDIQNSLSDLISKKLPAEHGKMFPVKSSGSTGTPVEVRNSSLMSVYNLATTIRGHLWHGRDHRRTNLDIRGPWADGPPKPARWMPFPDSARTIFADVSTPISELLDKLIAVDPGYVQSHPSVFSAMAELSEARGRKPKSLLEARAFGEALEPYVRDTLRRAWSIETKENYSALEFGTVAVQCPKSENLHVQAEMVYMEILRDDGAPCGPGETGRVVITSLHNYATPLIRYAIGDYATLGGACSCGRTLPVLLRVNGRHRNLVQLPNGDRFFPVPGPEFLTLPAVRQFKLIQKTIERIEVHLVLNTAPTAEISAAIRRQLTAGLRYPFEFDLIFADHIALAPNGKFELFTSEVGA